MAATMGHELTVPPEGVDATWAPDFVIHGWAFAGPDPKILPDVPNIVFLRRFELFDGSFLKVDWSKVDHLICVNDWIADEVEIQEQRTVDPNRFVFDCSKAERFLGFKAQYSFKEGLSKMLGEMGYDKTKS